jgi:alkylation response protein AidB-like acyl-CoA dehydrogenase
MTDTAGRAAAQQPHEDLPSFRSRARAWLAATMPRTTPDWDPVRDDDDQASQARALQRLLWDGGFAGICYPRAYGGLGLPPEYQHAFHAEAEGYKMPDIFSTPTMSIIGPVLLEHGTEEQKLRYIPGFLRGEELWVQFMSEPSGGSDMAGALTRATRDGDTFVLNGSKIWSTYAYRADLALALVRTSWDVPKHRGLTMIIVPVHHPAITVTQIAMVDGSVEFCQEFFDDVPVPAANVVGEVNDGWSVATRLLFHERAAVGGSSPYLSVPHLPADDNPADLIRLARHLGRDHDPAIRELLGETVMLATVRDHLAQRIAQGITAGQLPPTAGSILRLFSGLSLARRATIALEITGDTAIAWPAGTDPGDIGVKYVQRQARCIGGGTTEMARNIISERILNMPREPAPDRDIPFSQVPTATRRSS